MTTPTSRRQRWRERKRYRRTTRLLAVAIAVMVGAGVVAGAWWTQRPSDQLSAPIDSYVPPSSIFPSSRPPQSSSATAAESTSTPTSTSTSTSAKTPSSSGSKSAAPPTKGPSASHSSTRASDAPAPAGEPTRVQVHSGGRSVVDANLQATKLDSQKVLAPDFGMAGWYAEPGWPKPGHAGASILVGHINHGSNPDVFWNLPRVSVGDVVTVTYGSGSTVKFKITRSEAASKTGVPKDDSIWDWDNPDPVLRLITCDPQTPLNGGHYEGNWVVWADQLVS